MATEEEIEKVLYLMKESGPMKTFEKFKHNDMGIIAVLKYIYEHDSNIHSVDISKTLEISSARIAVILKKLHERGLIEKTSAKDDARAIIVKLTPQGEKLCNQRKTESIKCATNLIKEFGFTELKDLFSKINRLKKILDESMMNIKEKENV